MKERRKKRRKKRSSKTGTNRDTEADAQELGRVRNRRPIRSGTAKFRPFHILDGTQEKQRITPYIHIYT